MASAPPPTSSSSSPPLSPIPPHSASSTTHGPSHSKFAFSLKNNRWRHYLGILLLLCTVILWTASNFLASTIFADNTYSKPYFITYVNSSFFVGPLVVILGMRWMRGEIKFEWLWRRGGGGARGRYERLEGDEEEAQDGSERGVGAAKVDEEEEGHIREDIAGIGEEQIHSSLDDPTTTTSQPSPSSTDKLSLAATCRLSLHFCLIWFVANYFTAACLHYTTVASSTILTSTSSIFTLLIGSFFHIEALTLRKILGVLASLLGVVLISSVDFSGEGQDDEHRGGFPKKSAGEIVLGDGLALASAVLYGCYAVFMKLRIGDERRIDMPLFFGLVGFFNVALLWPGLVVLHFAGVERFELPPTGRVTAIVLINSLASLISDFCWAFAMLLTTSPLLITIGLSMTIPLSLIGQMWIQGQYAPALYWVGAVVVVGSFVGVGAGEADAVDQEVVKGDEGIFGPRDEGEEREGGGEIVLVNG
ncbi:hypothetical protein K402DRAFT_393546 [Aulographum hederae CBS 113979]|uniref:Uncharacterized protein n=1 Tax=Aulographum hederae CBS 113979 TaxID=1176131 RepID=A0A6G1H094_9PEZI|nr:hypothetical protein K402DRAFT_393546 [Aulographum hederae CBS 113979]